MTPIMPISIPMDVFLALADCIGDRWYSDEMAAAVNTAILTWVAAQGAQGGSGSAAPCDTSPAASGYQWKQLFLPAGTLLRTVLNGINHHAKVEGDHIIYNGTPVSPSAFVNAGSVSGRSAWRSLWLLLPGSRTWQLAASLRTATA
ncbi:MAG: hypothetical protein V4724_31980 [Pseudomonadota bacterium]